MNSLENIQHVYLIGIGGIGMSALAKYFHLNGKTVAGYDRTPTDLTRELVDLGIPVINDHEADVIPDQYKKAQNKQHALIIYTPAVPKDHPHLNYFHTNGYQVLKRSEVLGMLSENYRTIAVAGTHGKTTTSSIMAHLLRSSSLDCNAFLGGISTNYGSNLLSTKTSDLLVVEADEFDRSFLTLSPELAIITSIDPDHLDVYGSADDMVRAFHDFTDRIISGGTLIYRSGLPFGDFYKESLTYSVTERCDYYATDLSVESGQFRFNLVTPSRTWKDLRFGMPGIHNVENAVAAFVAAERVGLSENEIRTGLESYQGVKRRFEVHINTEELVYVDDYAHHPTEITACISSIRQMFPGRTVKGIFQPHLFSRTKDHMTAFANSLKLLDEVILLDIYPAREVPVPGITSAALLEKVNLPKKLLLSASETIQQVSAANTDVLLTMGAGDIDQLVAPIKKKLLA